MEISDNFILTIDKRKNIENTIANIIVFLKESYENKINEELKLEKFIDTLKKEINELSYEKESIDIYNKENEVKELELQLTQLNTVVNKSEVEIKNLN